MALPLRWPVRTWCHAEASSPWVIKAVAGIAVVVFILARFTTNTGVLLLVGSIVVLLVCFGLLKRLEGNDENTGYWSRDPKQ